VIDFLFVIVKLFSLSLTVETLSAEICQSRRFSKWGSGHFECKFQTEGDVAYQPLLVSEKQSDWPFVCCQTICNALFVLSQSTRETDRITTPKDRASIDARAVETRKMHRYISFLIFIRTLTPNTY